MSSVARPIVRSFDRRFAREAAAHVRAGGHAVVWDRRRRAQLVVPKPSRDRSDLGAWAIYDLGRSKWRVHDRGLFAGLASIRVPKSGHWVVRRRAERDSIHPGPTRDVSFDCTACAACCKDNEVFLEERDLVRFREAGREDLTAPPVAQKRRDGKLVLTLLPSKRCRNLDDHDRCAIYELRPAACSEFPVGSECCLYAREAELGTFDGVAPGR